MVRGGVPSCSSRCATERRAADGAYSQEIGSKSQDVFAAPVSSELSDSQKNAMLDPDTHHAWKQREFWYFVLVFLGVIGFLILVGNVKAYL